jgi:cation diffusion facilitator family transporter
MKRAFSRIPRPEARAILLSVVLGSALLAIKLTSYFITGSAAIFSDAMESIVNVLASGIALYALSIAHRPPDDDHPYGHGKIEFISAGLEGGMILLAAVVIAVRSMDEILFHDTHIQHVGFGMALVTTAAAINGGAGLYLIRVGRKSNSMALEADGHHLLSDALTSVAALGALLLVWITGHAWIDPAVALGMAGYIAWMGLRLLRRSAAGLMDEQDHTDTRRLRDLLDRHIGPGGAEPRICSYHKLRHRHSGRYHWVDFHLVIHSSADIRHAHHIASTIEYEIEQMLGVGNATAHVEPCADADCRRCIDLTRGA